MLIVGIDYSVDPTKTGLALGSFEDDHVRVMDVTLGSKKETPARIILGWLKKDYNILIALDAPLGWPQDLGRILFQHEAGKPLASNAAPDNFFSRLTDQVVKKELNKKPLEVGANLIARTAYGALLLLQELRDKSEFEIPLLWQQSGITRASAIEVYPAGTLKASDIEPEDYRKTRGGKARLRILDALGLAPVREEVRILVEKSPHALDAVICLTAAADFLMAKCIPITDMDKAHKEGWIWVKRHNLSKHI